jgi:hypothetical protein
MLSTCPVHHQIFDFRPFVFLSILFSIRHLRMFILHSTYSTFCITFGFHNIPFPLSSDLLSKKGLYTDGWCTLPKGFKLALVRMGSGYTWCMYTLFFSFLSAGSQENRQIKNQNRITLKLHLFTSQNSSTAIYSHTHLLARRSFTAVPLPTLSFEFRCILFSSSPAPAFLIFGSSIVGIPCLLDPTCLGLFCSCSRHSKISQEALLPLLPPPPPSLLFFFDFFCTRINSRKDVERRERERFVQYIVTLQ